MNTNQTTLGDHEILEDMLYQEKQLISAYATFIPETSCPNLRKVLTDNLNECANNQYQVFEAMSSRGWYPTQNAPMPDVDAARQKFAQMKQQMG